MSQKWLRRAPSSPLLAPILPVIAIAALAPSCVNRAVLERRAAAWEEEASVLESRGDARGAGELRDLASKAREGGAAGAKGSPASGPAVPAGRLDRQVHSLSARAGELYRDSRLDEARLVLSEALEKDPAQKEALDLRARIESEKFLPRRDRPFADMADELYEKGMKRLRRGETREAFDLLSQARQVYRDDEVLERAYARCARELEALDKSLQANDLFKKGRELLDGGKPEEADRLFAQAQALDPGLPRVAEYRDQASEAMARGRLQAISSGLASARSRAEKGNFEGAEAGLGEVLALDPQNQEGLALRADILEKRQQASEEQKKNALFLELLSRAREALARADPDTLRRALGEARTLKPSAKELEELGKKLARLEETRNPESKTAADEAYRQGMVAYRQGRPEESVGFFREALRLDPTHAKAAKALERLGAPAVAP